MGGGGAERVVSLLANSLATEENTVSLLTIVGGESFYPLKENVVYKSIGASISKKNFFIRAISKAVFFPKALIHIHRELKRGKYDVVISMLPETDILVGLCKTFGLKFRHVCSERNDPTKRSRLRLFILSRIYKKSSLFVCQGKRVFDFYKKVPENVKCVIPNPVDGAGLPERTDNITKRIVAVGRLDAQKNFPLLINSFTRVAKHFPDYKLDIYGEGTERKTLEALIARNNMQEKIVLNGAKKNVKELISDAELFVMSSNYEGFPNALLEAMAIGLPVISTDFPTGIASELISNENGIVVPTGDEDAMVKAIEGLLSNKDLAYLMGKNNREKCKNYYVENIIKEWKDKIASIT
jgi:glycosyltransferase involved in cell wall biosynthesis